MRLPSSFTPASFGRAGMGTILLSHWLACLFHMVKDMAADDCVRSPALGGPLACFHPFDATGATWLNTCHCCSFRWLAA